MKDYKIGTNGMFVTMLSERACQRIGSKALFGWSLSFNSTEDTAEFVKTGEAAGYTFEGKEVLAAD